MSTQAVHPEEVHAEFSQIGDQRRLFRVPRAPLDGLEPDALIVLVLSGTVITKVDGLWCVCVYCYIRLRPSLAGARVC